MSEKTSCKWCDKGYSIKNGEHWIVTSIVPAKIIIRKCTAVK